MGESKLACFVQRVQLLSAHLPQLLTVVNRLSSASGTAPGTGHNFHKIVGNLAFSKGGRPIYESIVKRASSNPDPEMAKTNLKMAMDMPVMNLFMGNSRRSEVDTISGSVVRAGKKGGVPTPSHEFLVGLIHAMEGRPKA